MSLCRLKNLNSRIELKWRLNHNLQMNRFMTQLRSSLILPPREKRKMVGGKLKAILYPHLTTQREDTYIYYLTIRNAAFVLSMLLLPYLASLILSREYDFGLFSIYLNPDNLVRSFIWSYSFVAPSILFATVFPLSLAMFALNVNLDRTDLLAWNPMMLERTNGERTKVMRATRTGGLLCLACMYGSFALPEMILRYELWHGLNNSFVFLIVVISFLLFVLSAALNAILFCSCAYYQASRNMGPRFSNHPNIPKEA